MSSERIDHVAATEQLYGTELTEVYSESVICLASLDACLPEEMINVPIETYGSETAKSKHETVKAGLDSNQQHYMSLCMDIKDLLIKADAERSGLGAKNELLHILQGKPTPLKTDRGTHQLLGVYDWVMTEEGGQTKPVKDMTYADMAQYVAKLYEVYPPPSQESVQEASEARQSFIGMLESDLFKSLIPDEAIRANMAQVALATPIRIADPLVVAIEYNLDAYENLGMFDPTTRSISIRWDWDKLPSSDKTMDIQTTVFHELLHACESTVYGDEYMSDFFPVFMREAVVEKLAFLMASQLGRGREVARKGTRSELIYRKVVGAADATLVPTRNTPERDVYDQRFDSLEPFTYQQFRLLFDEVFAIIDLKKSGINT